MSAHRESPIELSGKEFKEAGYLLIDAISELINTIRDKPVTTAEKPEELLRILGDKPLPENGSPASDLLVEAAMLLTEHSLFNGHPKFMGYITSSAAPAGVLADLLAAAVNPNVGANILSPMATEIEKQTIRWLAEFIGVSDGFGGILVSGGNMANFTAFLAARTAKASEGLTEKGLAGEQKELLVYCSKATHVWIEKAAVLFGHGKESIRWIRTDAGNKMDTSALESAISTDAKNGYKPFLVVGTAGDVSTGAVDDFRTIANICKRNDLWFHIDGAYGMPAAVLPEHKHLFAGAEEADSIALDPHKWLYSPLEVGCTLVKNPRHLTDAFSSHPDYYNFDISEEGRVQNYYEYGLQNSRGFRALKVWITLRQVGRRGYAAMIREDIQLSELLFDLAAQHVELEAVTHSLSITTLRYVPPAFKGDSEANQSYLNTLNEKLLNTLQEGGEVFLSNAIVNGKYCLRACIVNFRTSRKDIGEIIDIIVREGAKIHKNLQRD